MNPYLLIAAVSFLTLLQGFGFASLYFKEPKPFLLFQTAILYTIFTVVFLSAGYFLGGYFNRQLPEMAIEGGLAIFIVLTLKLAISAVRKKPFDRIFDISKPVTYIGLLIAINIDEFLAGLGAGMIAPNMQRPLIVIFAAAGLLGFIGGGLAGRKTGLLMSNKLELIIAIAFTILIIYGFVS